MFNGILNIYKEKGYTSHDVVAKMRGILKQKKIGHTGTLDPDARGVLPVCLGQATKLCDLLVEHDKTYKAVMLLGIETDTQDTSGKILLEKPVTCSEELVRNAVLGYIGIYNQVPPMYSARKVNGKKLYELARQGKVVERKSRQVSVYDIHIEEINLPEVTMTVKCSKGTYIRTLCHDIGQTLGCGGCMKSLIRTQTGQFRLEESITLSQLEKIRDEGLLEQYMISVEEMFETCPAVYVKKEADNLVWNGNPVKPEMTETDIDSQFENGIRCRVYDSSRRFLGVYEFDKENHRLKVWKMFQQ
ncbi:MAG: tRNA pseudouridine(55) synthase TruB [Hungatella sp.]|nr:tRNA pseudouridine(55) synthase TruB [Hungatella sp.]